MWGWSCNNYIVPLPGSCLALGKMTLFDRLSVGATWAERDVSFLHRNAVGNCPESSERPGLIIMFSFDAIF